jgi:hypothetical protein
MRTWITLVLCACATEPVESTVTTRELIAIEEPGDPGDDACYCPTKAHDEVKDCVGTYQSCPVTAKKEDCKLKTWAIQCKKNACGTEAVEAHTGCEWKRVINDAYGCFPTGYTKYNCSVEVVDPKVEVRNDRCPDTPANTCNAEHCEVRVGGGEWFENACSTMPSDTPIELEPYSDSNLR